MYADEVELDTPLRQIFIKDLSDKSLSSGPISKTRVKGLTAHSWGRQITGPTCCKRLYRNYVRARIWFPINFSFVLLCFTEFCRFTESQLSLFVWPVERMMFCLETVGCNFHLLQRFVFPQHPGIKGHTCTHRQVYVQSHTHIYRHNVDARCWL